jgi:CBS domain-containing protein
MEDKLSQLDQEESVIAEPDAQAFEVVEQMAARRTGCALVLDGKRLAGIFTEHDVLKKMTNPRATSQTLVKDLMSPNPEVLKEGDSVAAALNRMSIGRYRHIPVVRADGSYGVVSIKNVLKYIAREDW